MKTLQQLQTELDALQVDVEMTESGIAEVDPDLIEDAKRQYLCDLKSAVNSYLSELWMIERKIEKTA